MPSYAGLVNQPVPTASADSLGVTGRLDRVTETELASIDQNRIAGDGNYFRATNPTWGTTITWSAASAPTTFDSTKCILLCRHRGGPGLPTITVDYIRITNCTPPTTTASLHFAVVTDRLNREVNF